MPGCSSLRSDEARVSATSSPARRSAASRSGCESGLRPGASNASRTSAASASSPAGRAPRGGRGPSRSVSSRSWTSTRHGQPGVGHLGGDERARRLGGEQQTQPGRLGRGRDGGELPGVLEVGAQVLDRVVDEKSAGSDGAAGPSRSQCSDCRRRAAARRQRERGAAGGDRAAGRGTAHAHTGRQQRRVPPGGVVPDPARRLGLARRRRTPAGAARSRVRSSPASTTRTRSPGRRESATRVTGTPWHPPWTAKTGQARCRRGVR